jgi:hypothetical protein
VHGALFNDSCEDVATHPHRFDERRAAGIVLNLLSQPTDVNIDAPFNGAGETGMRGSKQFFAAEYSAGGSAKRDEQVKFGRRHVNHSPIGSAQGTLPWIEAPAIESEGLWQAMGGATIRCPSQHAADPSKHFSDPEWTGDAIVRSAFEGGKDDVLATVRNHGDDWHRAAGSNQPTKMKRTFRPDDRIQYH